MSSMKNKQQTFGTPFVAVVVIVTHKVKMTKQPLELTHMLIIVAAPACINSRIW